MQTLTHHHQRVDESIFIFPKLVLTTRSLWVDHARKMDEDEEQMTVGKRAKMD